MIQLGLLCAWVLECASCRQSQLLKEANISYEVPGASHKQLPAAVTCELLPCRQLCELGLGDAY